MIHDPKELKFGEINTEFGYEADEGIVYRRYDDEDVSFFDKQFKVSVVLINKKRYRTADVAWILARRDFPSEGKIVSKMIPGLPMYALSNLEIEGNEPTSSEDDQPIEIKADPTPVVREIIRHKKATATKNSKGRNTSRKGYWFDKGRGKWRGQIYKNGNVLELGAFDSEYEAIAAVAKARAQLENEDFVNIKLSKKPDRNLPKYVYDAVTSNKYKVICQNPITKKMKYLGTFDNVEDAVVARDTFLGV